MLFTVRSPARVDTAFPCGLLASIFAVVVVCGRCRRAALFRFGPGAAKYARVVEGDHSQRKVTARSSRAVLITGGATTLVIKESGSQRP